jgi:hypothetical protein
MLDLAGLAASVAVPLLGAVYGVGKIVQMVLDHEKRITRLEADDDAEDEAVRRERMRHK